jgi:hypothetical protein
MASTGVRVETTIVSCVDKKKKVKCNETDRGMNLKIIQNFCLISFSREVWKNV